MYTRRAPTPGPAFTPRERPTRCEITRGPDVASRGGGDYPTPHSGTEAARQHVAASSGRRAVSLTHAKPDSPFCKNNKPRLTAHTRLRIGGWGSLRRGSVRDSPLVAHSNAFTPRTNNHSRWGFEPHSLRHPQSTPNSPVCSDRRATERLWTRGAGGHNADGSGRLSRMSPLSGRLINEHPPP